MRSKKCKNCLYHRYSEPDEKGYQEMFCILDGHKVEKDEWEKITDCENFESEPFYCASCGTAITKDLEKTSNPLVYKRGKNKGKEKKCCDNPDWRVCPGPDEEYGCEGEAIVCRNCGYYYGLETW
jgi:hypothetical protein